MADPPHKITRQQITGRNITEKDHDCVISTALYCTVDITNIYCTDMLIKTIIYRIY